MEKALKWFLAICILAASIALAITAGFMSISGLAIIFAANSVTIQLTAIVIEFAKVVSVAGLHMFWKQLGWWKYTIVIFFAIHMTITSLGVYGYFNESHYAQNKDSQVIEVQIDAIDKEIEQKQKQIERYTSEIDLLDQDIIAAQKALNV